MPTGEPLLQKQKAVDDCAALAESARHADGHSIVLTQACAEFWEHGRQLCGAVSLTGQPCILPPHRVAADAALGLHGNAEANDSEMDASNRSVTSRTREAAAQAQHSSGMLYEVADLTGLQR